MKYHLPIFIQDCQTPEYIFKLHENTNKKGQQIYLTNIKWLNNKQNKIHLKHEFSLKIIYQKYKNENWPKRFFLLSSFQRSSSIHISEENFCFGTNSLSFVKCQILHYFLVWRRWLVDRQRNVSWFVVVVVVVRSTSFLWRHFVRSRCCCPRRSFLNLC